MSRNGGNRKKNNEIEEPNKNETPIGKNQQQSRDSEDNVLAVTANSMIPNSPPPSYEHVLEEARLEQTSDENEVQTDVAGRICDGNRSNYNANERVDNQRVPQNVKGREILHKSSKEFYRAVAKQWGITCKMSDHCRCLDCQSHYFDCEYEKDEQGKSDGGLSAGTPMFVNEILHGTGCSLL